MSRKKIPFKFGDIVLCTLILTVAAVMFFTLPNGKAPLHVIVTHENGENVYDLSQDREIEINSHGHRLKVKISDGEVSVIESDCPDKVCEASGKISSPGRVIVCVPAGVTVKLEGSDENIDWVAS